MSIAEIFQLLLETTLIFLYNKVSYFNFVVIQKCFNEEFVLWLNYLFFTNLTSSSEFLIRL